MSRKQMIKAAIAITLILMVAVWAMDGPIRERVEALKQFHLSEVALETVDGHSFKIPSNRKGYIVFYTEVVECSSCIRELGVLEKIARAYGEIDIFAVVKGSDGKRAFTEMMVRNGIPGEYLVDARGKIQRHLGLGNHPLLLFFNSDQHLIATLPMDVDHELLVRQIHRYVTVM